MRTDVTKQVVVFRSFVKATKMILKNKFRVFGPDSSNSKWGPAAGPCQYGDETEVPQHRGNCLTSGVNAISQDGPSCVGLGNLQSVTAGLRDIT